jgi:adenylosuccinate lyase
MIDRYTLPEIGRIWSDENRLTIWLKIELLACEMHQQLGLIPVSALKNIKDRARFDVKRTLEIEAEVRHDVIAFLTNVAEYVGDDARYLHYGLTSSDILDTALAVQMVEASELLKNSMRKLLAVLKRRALETKQVPMIGRSHGIHAEPITLGFKLAVWYAEIQRQLGRLEQAVESVRVGKISGAVGTYEHIDPRVQEYVCEKLGLHSATISTQILQRDRHAHFLSALALIGCSLEKFAVEIRHLQRTEVSEAAEYFSGQQKGSSAMPHKRNPVISERICGLARLLRGNALVAMENVALWHERDISHSSVERIILPDSTVTLYYMLQQTIQLLDNLEFYPERMLENMNRTKGLIHSQAVLLALTRKGMSREDAYRLVQRNAMRVWKENIPFKSALLQDDGVRPYLSQEEIEQFFTRSVSPEKIDYIFKKVGLES